MKAEVHTLQTINEGCFSVSFRTRDIHTEDGQGVVFFNRHELLELAGAMEAATWTDEEAMGIMDAINAYAEIQLSDVDIIQDVAESEYKAEKEI